MDAIWLSAFGLGALGSLHCAAMCGPLAIAGCSRGPDLDKKSGAGYVLGRVVAYGTAGAACGAIGQGVHAWHGGLASANQAATWIVAALALAQGIRLFVIALRAKSPPLVQIGTRTRGNPLLRFFARLLPRRGLGLGLATGALPCGLLSSGWLLAATAGDAPRGAGVMFIFALASFPALLAPLFARRWLADRRRTWSPLWYGLAWCALACWIGARPLFMSLHHHG